MFNISRDVYRYTEIAGLLLSMVITGLSYSFIPYMESGISMGGCKLPSNNHVEGND